MFLFYFNGIRTHVDQSTRLITDQVNSLTNQVLPILIPPDLQIQPTNSSNKNNKKPNQNQNQKTLGMAWGNHPLANLISEVIWRLRTRNFMINLMLMLTIRLIRRCFPGFRSLLTVLQFLLVRSFSRGLPVVKPTWVLDCVAANKVLNWVPYQLDQLVETVKQPKLSAFFIPKTNHEVANTPANCMIPGVGSSQKSDSSPESPSSDAGESVQQTPEFDGEISVLDQEKPVEVNMNEVPSTGETLPEHMMPEPSSSNLDGREGFKSSSCKSSASANEHVSSHDKKTSPSAQLHPIQIGSFNYGRS